MIIELEDKEKLIKLKNILDKFLIDDEKCVEKCMKCKHKRICDLMYDLYMEIEDEYIGNANN
ncbi:hypothetical protein [Clostridium perfringens]|uniref:hypothetical protein n=1 Tax=Clostridium perfringens TaxID=1502 RepID=UPI003F41F57B